MVLSDSNGLLVEVMNPAYPREIEYCWISDKQTHLILVYGKSETMADAVDIAAKLLPADLAALLPADLVSMAAALPARV